MTYSDVNANNFLSSLESYLKGPFGRRDQELEEIRSRLATFVEKGDIQTAEKACQLLGNAAGQKAVWRSRFREAGVLTQVLQALHPATKAVGLVKQYLRVIGNCVVDNDDNRAIVAEYLETLIACLEQPEFTSTTIGVMLNLCNDFDPAQNQAAELRLDSTVAEYLVSSRIPEEAVDFSIELITWVTEKLTTTQVEDNTSLKTFVNLLTLALRYNEDHYFDYVAIIAHYAQGPEFQQKLATPETLESLVDLALDYEARLDKEEVQGVFKALAAQQDPKKAPSEDTNILLMVQLINSLSAISASDAFVRTFNIRDPIIKKLSSRVASLSTSPLTVCACVMLGNLATSDETCVAMIEEMEMHTNLLGILLVEKEPALLYAAAGFMRHLAFPENKRTALGETQLIFVCCYLLINRDPSVRGESAAIIGKLVSNNLPNIKKIVREPWPEGNKLAQLPGVEVPDNPTLLYHIVTQALVSSAPVPSTSMKNAVIELPRTIVTMLRFLGQSKAKEDAESLKREMFDTPLVARPVAQLVRQRFFADARSEGLLGLGLMAQSPEGAVCVARELKADNGLLRSIKELTTAEKSEGQNSGTIGRDLQNALVLLHGLARHGTDAMEPSLEKEVDDLQSELSRLTL